MKVALGGIVNDDPPPVQEAVVETILEEEAKPVKPKPKTKAKPKIKITKEPAEPIKEQVTKEPEPIIDVEEKIKNIDTTKQMANWPDCNLSMTQHTLKHIHKKRGYCKGAFQEEVKEEVKKGVTKEPPGLPKQKPTKTITNITDDIVNTHIKENPGTVTDNLRNKRVMKAQRKQMNARSLLNNAF